MGGGKNKPRAGSLAFYPKKRAARELATFSTVGSLSSDKAKPVNFIAYKAGMVHGTARNMQEKTVSFGQSILVPATVLECPPMTVFGVRAYSKYNGVFRSFGEATTEKVDKHFRKKFSSFKKMSSKKKEKEQKRYTSVDDLEKQVDKILQVRLLCHTSPSALGFGKKRPDVCEVFLSGSPKEQLAFAKDRFGKDIFIEDVISEKHFVDVKAVDAGKGFSGVIKRFGVKQHRPKAKKRRIVGSIGPWNPSTVMRSVARAGQLGYQTRTELNKRVLKISKNSEEINVPGGFEGYGNVKSTFILLAGSTPGPVKRAVSLRVSIRKQPKGSFNVSELSIVGLKKKSKLGAEQEEDTKAQKVVAQKEQKKEHKSVEDEIKSAVGAKK